MDNLRQLGNRISIALPRDQDGFTGRECPNPDCEGYFKIRFGTGLKGENIPCHCPYCGHTASQDHFWTKAQINYAKSVALRKVTEAIRKDLKKFEFDYKPKGGFGLGISLKIKPGAPIPVRYYREKQLETQVTCNNCTLVYSVFGVFAFCPDCGLHNSLQIFEKNLDLVAKMLEMATTTEREMSARLIENALEDCVSSFDGFGRAICQVHLQEATDLTKAQRMSFQNLEGAKHNLMTLFSIDLGGGVAPGEWAPVVQAFQKRHLLSHKMGVIDEEYVKKTNDPTAVVGRKVATTSGEVTDLIRILHGVAQWLSSELTRLHRPYALLTH